MVYMCIDLKSFYASCECVERNLDPLRTNLVVADNNRTEKTICLAVTPPLKEYGIKGRARLYEVVSKIKEINKERKKNNHYQGFKGCSVDSIELKNNPSLKLDYIVANPRMSLYMKYSIDIFNIYLKFLSKDDIFVYSIDEVFCDLTPYLKYYGKSSVEITRMIVKEVYKKTGITATAGVGSNMYLAKIAMDITAKHMPADKYGCRIASLDIDKYRKELWNHTPLTAFWQVGKGYQEKLNRNHIYTMGDIARVSIDNEDLLYKLFGVNAEILIDHAWGVEPVTMKDVKEYRPKTTSKNIGQVLHEPYDYLKTKVIIREMIEDLTLYLVEKRLVTSKLVLVIGYDISNMNQYDGEIMKDHYGRVVPKHARKTINIDHKTSSNDVIIKEVLKGYDSCINKELLIRRINISALDLERDRDDYSYSIQLDLFKSVDFEKKKEELEKEKSEKNIQKSIINIKKKYGKNAILKGIDLLDEATARDRNSQVGGHKA